MQSTTDGLNAATLWLVNAFHISAQEAAKPDMLKIFIEFYWRLHRHTADDAKSYLHGVCKQRKMDWRPDLSIQLRPVAARAATRKKRRKREGAENMYGADVEDNAAADRVRVARSISDSNVDTPTRSRRNARGSSVRNEVVRISAAIQSPSAPVKPSGESKLNVRAGSRRVRRPRKRKSRKHGASSSSAASEEDVPEEKSFVTTEETTFSHVVSSNDEHPEPARDDSQSIPKPIVFTKSALPKGSETCTQVSTSTEAVHDTPVSDSVATPVVEVALSPAKKPLIPLLKASLRKQNPIPKRPTRMQPHRPAAKREQLTESPTKEHLYQESRGRQDDAFTGLSTSRKESTGSATPKAVGKSVSALPEEDAAHSKEVETIHRNDADTSGNAQDAPRPGLLSSRQPKTAKKPIVLRQDDSILTQVAKRRRRNDGTASSPSPGVIGTTMNTERPKTVKKPTVVQQDESILTQMAKRSRRGDGETPSLSPGLGETANGIARSETAITHPPQPNESAHQCNAENLSSLGNHIDTGAVLTESGDAEKASDQRVEPSVTSRELERGRKRSRSQDGATDGPSERLSHEAEDDKKKTTVLSYPRTT
ncbi:hypothetical protein NM688_g5148 [Phlebia brevispora]|uniref:Uncharacterized protein n=1 Tax=Phlebia brevispora TaxID=194682 RepID=A0ACC1SZW0_9APHY|nr:hypothetical protein NM688_g5148 [Phlebia brevispora]